MSAGLGGGKRSWPGARPSISKGEETLDQLRCGSLDTKWVSLRERLLPVTDWLVAGCMVDRPRARLAFDGSCMDDSISDESGTSTTSWAFLLTCFHRSVLRRHSRNSWWWETWKTASGDVVQSCKIMWTSARNLLHAVWRNKETQTNSTGPPRDLTCHGNRWN